MSLQNLRQEMATLYHGTSCVFDRFIPSLTGAQGPGIYMTDTPSTYGSICMHLRVNMMNPYIFRPSDESLEAEINYELIEQVLPSAIAQSVLRRIEEQGPGVYGYEVQNALKAQGHDGILMIYPFGEAVLEGTDGAAVVIAFDPDQVEVIGIARSISAYRDSDNSTKVA
jgi:hypothetical protein